MTRRTVTMRKLNYWKARDRRQDKLQKFNKLPSEMAQYNNDFLQFLKDKIGDEANWNYTDAKKGHYCRVRSVQVFGQTILFTARVGACGESGEIVGTGTNKTVISHVGDHANVVLQRVLIAVPKSTQTVVIVVENVSDYSSTLGTKLTEKIREEWNTLLPDWTLDVETVIRSEDWLDTATVGSINATLHKSSRTGEEPAEVMPGGELKVEFTPPKGDGSFNKKILGKLFGDKDYAQDLLGLSEPPDKVAVTMTDGVQQRTYDIDGEARTPAFREIITDNGVAPLSEKQFVDFARDHARQVLERLGDEYNLS